MRAAFVLLATALVACGGTTVVDPGGGGSTSSSGGSGGTTNSSSSSSSAGGIGGTGAGVGGQGGVGGAGGVVCNPTAVECNGIPPDCPVGEVPSVVGGCWGSCVPVLDCATEPSCDDCPIGFCAEYQAFTVEYRCVLPTTLMCSSLSCACAGDYFCASPYDACVATPGPADIACSCPSC